MVFVALGEYDALKSDKPSLAKVIPLSSKIPVFDASWPSQLEGKLVKNTVFSHVF